MPLALALALTCVASVHDGDNVRLCSGEKVQLAAIYAPELRGSPSCSRRKRASHWCDFALGIESRDALRGLVAGPPVTIRRTGIDRSVARSPTSASMAGMPAAI